MPRVRATSSPRSARGAARRGPRGRVDRLDATPLDDGTRSRSRSPTDGQPDVARRPRAQPERRSGEHRRRDRRRPAASTSRSSGGSSGRSSRSRSAAPRATRSRRCAPRSPAPTHPPPPTPVVGLPTASRSPTRRRRSSRQRGRGPAVVSFAAALFGQLSSPISDTFGASDTHASASRSRSRASARCSRCSRIALADRRGRRRSILIGVVGSALVCAISAVAPTLAFLTGAQVLQRGVRRSRRRRSRRSPSSRKRRKAPARTRRRCSRSRAASVSRSSVVTLPIADIGDAGLARPVRARRAGARRCVRPIARTLSETTRYTALAHAPTSTGAASATSSTAATAGASCCSALVALLTEHLQRTVVAVHEQVPHRRPRTSRTPASPSSGP